MIVTGETEVLGEKHYTAWVVDEWMSMEHWWNDSDRGNWSTGRKTLHALVVDEWVWSTGGMILTGETEVLGETCPNNTLFSKSRTWTDPASNLGLCERSATNRLSHSSAGGIYWPTKRLSAYVHLYGPNVCFKQMKVVTAPVAIFCTKWLLLNIGPSPRSCLSLVALVAGVRGGGCWALAVQYIYPSLSVPLTLSLSWLQ